MTERSITQLRAFKAKWRDQVCDDAGVKPHAFKIAYAMADYVTMDDSAQKFRKTGKLIIWPSQIALQERTSVSVDTIRTSVASLIHRGHLKRTKRGNQFTGSNRYRMVIKKSGEST